MTASKEGLHLTIDADRKIKELSRAIIADAGLPYTPEQLAEIPAILAAKNRYFWCIDNQEFDLMPDVFTETGFRTFWSGRPGFRDHTYKDNGQTYSGYGLYVDDLVKCDDDRWRIQTLRLTYRLLDGELRRTK